MLNINFPLLLLFLTVASGAIWLVDAIFFAKSRPIIPKEAKTKDVKTDLPLIVDYAKSLFPVFLVVFLLRSFVASLFVVPSGSLEPTVIPGDFVFVTHYSYGLRLPIWNKLLVPIGQPKIGDIAVFHWPVNPEVDFIKRVVGVPGDKISYIDNVFYINGKEMPQTYLSNKLYGDPGLPKWRVNKMQEDLMGVKHDIYVCPTSSVRCPGHIHQNFYNLIVPKGEYFLVGDNRNDSDDSRYWGFVPEKDLVGKAQFIIFSWDSATKNWLNKIRWSRIGTLL